MRVWVVPRPTLTLTLTPPTAHTYPTLFFICRNFLRQVPLLSHLSEESIGRLADALQHVTVAAGEVVLAEGDVSSGRCFLVESGALQVSAEGREGESHTLLPGDLFGEESLAQEATVQPCTVTALEDARLLLMDRHTALSLVLTPRQGAEGAS